MKPSSPRGGGGPLLRMSDPEFDRRLRKVLAARREQRLEDEERARCAFNVYDDTNVSADDTTMRNTTSHRAPKFRVPPKLIRSRSAMMGFVPPSEPGTCNAFFFPPPPRSRPTQQTCPGALWALGGERGRRQQHHHPTSQAFSPSSSCGGKDAPSFCLGITINLDKEKTKPPREKTSLPLLALSSFNTMAFRIVTTT